MRSAIPDCREKTVIAMFIKGLFPGSTAHMNLATQRPKTFDELLDRVEAHAQYEEDLSRERGWENRSWAALTRVGGS